MEVTLPTGLSPRTTLYLFAEGTSYPIHTVDVAVLDKEYVLVLGNYERDDKMIALTFDCFMGKLIPITFWTRCRLTASMPPSL